MELSRFYVVSIITTSRRAKRVAHEATNASFVTEKRTSFQIIVEL